MRANRVGKGFAGHAWPIAFLGEHRHGITPCARGGLQRPDRQILRQDLRQDHRFASCRIDEIKRKAGSAKIAHRLFDFPS
jgi:hypothetical protein